MSEQAKNRIHIKTDEYPTGNIEIYLEPDARGESESYEPYKLTAYAENGKLVWFEGVRKDRTEMVDEFRGLVENALQLAKKLL